MKARKSLASALESHAHPTGGLSARILRLDQVQKPYCIRAIQDLPTALDRHENFRLKQSKSPRLAMEQLDLGIWQV